MEPGLVSIRCAADCPACATAELLSGLFELAWDDAVSAGVLVKSRRGAGTIYLALQKIAG